MNFHVIKCYNVYLLMQSGMYNICTYGYLTLLSINTILGTVLVLGLSRFKIKFKLLNNVKNPYGKSSKNIV